MHETSVNTQMNKMILHSADIIMHCSESSLYMALTKWALEVVGNEDESSNQNIAINQNKV